MKITPSDAVDFCLNKVGLRPIWPIIRQVSDLSSTTKSVIFALSNSLQVAIPWKRTTVSCYVPAMNLAGDELPSDISTIHPDLTLRVRYPRDDGLDIADSVERNAPSLHPSKRPALLQVDSVEAFSALLQWLQRGSPVSAATSSQDVPHVDDSNERGEHPGHNGDSAETASQNELAEDVSELAEDPSLSPTERQQLVLARIGQGRFRRNVIDTWGIGECCAVTGTQLRRVLIASHIIPWRESEQLRLVGTNGILLCAHLDRLFDGHLISFADDGGIVFSSRLSRADRADLTAVGVKEGATLSLAKLRARDREAVHKSLAAHLCRMLAEDGLRVAPSQAAA